MTSHTITIAGAALPVYSVKTLVVGSGAAALNAAVTLHALGHEDLAIVTEAWGGGTSANAGSDKQTYYKLSLSGGIPDSPRQLAEDLFAGGCMHGDIALCEAQHSAQAFFHLVQLGVAFPHDRYGGYPGYRTDHDERGRATSAGPLTSRQMVEALAADVRARRIPVFESLQVVSLLSDRRGETPRIVGAMALDLSSCAHRPGFVLFNAPNVILGTGGPGGMYLDSVYPPEQTGSIGLAMRIGAVAQNLTESQFGLASIGFRWNVSGSYQQVIPRYLSTDASGGDAHEFLNEAFPDAGTLATAIFRKGYEWPFDARRVANHGSSLIDLLVHRERVERRRRVFLDFTRNFAGEGRIGTFSLDGLDTDARQYLDRSGAVDATPFGRLAAINQPAIDLYRSHGIDLAADLLEIAVCAQHNNGGLMGNIWWESNVTGLFPVGEVNGSHGIRRPGGSSLNAGQTGGLRAAMFIAHRRDTSDPDIDAFRATCADSVSETLAFAAAAEARRETIRRVPNDIRIEIQRRMSRAGSQIRSRTVADSARADAWALCRSIDSISWAPDAAALPAVFRNRDLCLAHAVYLDAIVEYLARGGQSRGPFVVMSSADTLGFSLNPPDAFVDRHILEVSLDESLQTHTRWVPVRPIPEPETWFETAWKSFRDGTVFD